VSGDDWYRSDAWDEGARELFERKLARARSRPGDCLRIKGLTLTGSDDDGRVAAGRQLLQRVIDDYGDDAMSVAGAHYALADSFARDDQLGQAEQHFRECVAVQAAAWARGERFSFGPELRLAEVLIARGEPPASSEAWDLLNVFAGSRPLFNSEIWRIEVARARLLEGAGDAVAAAERASAALALLAIDEPQLTRHPDVGLVDADPVTVLELRRIAAVLN
jgi:hypothetical protein